ncbi:MAG: NAD(P) transhydrogenase subunit alpha [Clostridia bacterium]|nr:NAD(P) transhydrogenase subunit alpha [Clostridia bacterium]MBO4733126.1 NAD(P) transhydrogenase subunit alpha [Clostridia bacterium]
MTPIILVIIFLVSTVVGYFIINNVPSLLHTPLMSGMNALSGVTVLGALAVTAVAIKPYSSLLSVIIGVVAIVLAVINIAAGFGVTARMLKMFKGEDKK